MWRAMDFQIEEAARFSYHYEATSEKSARAWAVADIGCSGEQVTYEVILEGRGTLTKDETEGAEAEGAEADMAVVAAETEAP